MALIYLDTESLTIGLRLTALAPQEFDDVKCSFKARFPKARWNGSKWILHLEYTDDLMGFFKTNFPTIRIVVIVVSSTAA